MAASVIERSEAARWEPGRELYLPTGECVRFKWLTLTGLRCETSEGAVTFAMDVLSPVPPVRLREAAMEAPAVELPAVKPVRARAPRVSARKTAAREPATRGFRCVQCGGWVSFAEHALARHAIKRCKAIPSASENVDWDARGLR